MLAGAGAAGAAAEGSCMKPQCLTGLVWIHLVQSVLALKAFISSLVKETLAAGAGAAAAAGAGAGAAAAAGAGAEASDMMSREAMATANSVIFISD